MERIAEVKERTLAILDETPNYTDRLIEFISEKNCRLYDEEFRAFCETLQQAMDYKR